MAYTPSEFYKSTKWVYKIDIDTDSVSFVFMYLK